MYFIEEVQHLTSADLAVIEQMKSTIDNQRDEIRSKNSEIGSVKSDLEAVCNTDSLGILTLDRRWNK